MDDVNGKNRPASGPELGASFEAHNSQSYGGDVGRSFEETNKSERPHKSRKWWWIVGLTVIVLALFLVYHLSENTVTTATKGGGGRGQTGPAAITTGQSKTGNINIYIDTLGTVTPTNTITLYSQITGRVIAVHYREGQMVRKGDPLIDIDPAPYQATLTQAEGTLKRDEGVLAEAKIDLARYQAAFAKNAIARQQVEDQEQAVVQDEGTIVTDKGTVDYDKVQLSYCHIVSPITGRVGLRLVDPGNTVFSGSGSTLVVITQLQPITVVFNVSEDDLGQIQTQLRAGHKLEVDAYDRANDKQIEAGKLTSLNNEVDTTTGTIKFRADFVNKKFDLFPNQFVNARLLVRSLDNATLVPSAAVQHNGTASFVYLVQPYTPAPADNKKKAAPRAAGAPAEPVPTAKVVVQPITVLTSNDQVSAVQGIDTGVTLATSGFDRLENNVPVVVRNQPAGQRSTTAAAGSPAK
jgi:multidrug efflux system membrane fusion protein